ncbi:MAG TPA: hypothetical protein VMY41_13730 [Thermohalobaculum sp.]|nr:hypothetical protein [Thermohalobaculum sp.]
MRLRTQKEFFIALACYSVSMVALAGGIWIAGGPTRALQRPLGIVAMIPADCSDAAKCLILTSLDTAQLTDGR